MTGMYVVVRRTRDALYTMLHHATPCYTMHTMA